MTRRCISPIGKRQPWRGNSIVFGQTARAAPARSVAMVHTPGVGWAPDTESQEEQEAHWRP